MVAQTSLRHKTCDTEFFIPNTFMTVLLAYLFILGIERLVGLCSTRRPNGSGTETFSLFSNIFLVLVIAKSDLSPKKTLLPVHSAYVRLFRRQCIQSTDQRHKSKPRPPSITYACGDLSTSQDAHGQRHALHKQFFFLSLLKERAFKQYPDVHMLHASLFFTTPLIMKISLNIM